MAFFRSFQTQPGNSKSKSKSHSNYGTTWCGWLLYGGTILVLAMVGISLMGRIPLRSGSGMTITKGDELAGKAYEADEETVILTEFSEGNSDVKASETARESIAEAIEGTTTEETELSGGEGTENAELQDTEESASQAEPSETEPVRTEPTDSKPVEIESLSSMQPNEENEISIQDFSETPTENSETDSSDIISELNHTSSPREKKSEVSFGADDMTESRSQINFVEQPQLLTQRAESMSENEKTESSSVEPDDDHGDETPLKYTIPLCAPDKGVDYIPCLDNTKAIQALKTTKHYEHRERHCPVPSPMGEPGSGGEVETEGEGATCLVPLPEGYKPHINWPESRDQIWFSNVPHPKLASYKADQNWVREEGDKFVFPGGGTQFKHGATSYINFIQEVVPEISWGSHVRVALDMGCGVASWAAFLEPFNVRVMSIAPKDEHDAQIQFALERGVSAMLGVMGTQRQPFPSNVFDLAHCARCRVPWHADGGRLLLELNRLIRPGGYFVWSATPVYQKGEEDEGIWSAMEELARRMCWTFVAKQAKADDRIGIAVWQKPTSNDCYLSRKREGERADPPMCEEGDVQDAAWYVPMQSCLHPIPTNRNSRGLKWPVSGPARVSSVPDWLGEISKGLYGKPAGEEFASDLSRWEGIVREEYGAGETRGEAESEGEKKEEGVTWENVRNVLDVNAGYGGFAAALALVPSLPLWVMNVVPTSSPDTLAVIYERGFIGTYHDWCESFNTYPRTYDLLHVEGLFELDAERCPILTMMAEMDRILRPDGFVILRLKEEHGSILSEVKSVAKSLHWKLVLTMVSKRSPPNELSAAGQVVLVYRKTFWRPEAK